MYIPNSYNICTVYVEFFGGGGGGGGISDLPVLLLGPPFLPIILFLYTTLLTGMTGISLHVQWPLT
jgi:energy-converting hydrogenase Eha subunit G